MPLRSAGRFQMRYRSGDRNFCVAACALAACSTGRGLDMGQAIVLAVMVMAVVGLLFRCCGCCRVLVEEVEALFDELEWWECHSIPLWCGVHQMERTSLDFPSHFAVICRADEDHHRTITPLSSHSAPQVARSPGRCLSTISHVAVVFCSLHTARVG